MSSFAIEVTAFPQGIRGVALATMLASYAGVCSMLVSINRRLHFWKDWRIPSLQELVPFLQVSRRPFMSYSLTSTDFFRSLHRSDMCGADNVSDIEDSIGPPSSAALENLILLTTAGSWGPGGRSSTSSSSSDLVDAEVSSSSS
eukprot:765906-Hanusia_phi.AAC.4